jgi:hypothetical protein
MMPKQVSTIEEARAEAARQGYSHVHSHRGGGELIPLSEFDPYEGEQPSYIYYIFGDGQETNGHQFQIGWLYEMSTSPVVAHGIVIGEWRLKSL